jgi:hypothetical protein
LLPPDGKAKAKLQDELEHGSGEPNFGGAHCCWQATRRSAGLRLADGGPKGGHQVSALRPGIDQKSPDRNRISTVPPALPLPPALKLAGVAAERCHSTSFSKSTSSSSPASNNSVMLRQSVSTLTARTVERPVRGPQERRRGGRRVRWCANRSGFY